MKQDRLKSVFAFLLAVLMAVTTMFSPLAGLTAKAENEIDVQLSLKEVNASGRWELNFALPEGESMDTGYYRVPATVDGVEKDILMEYTVYGNGTTHLFIYHQFFNIPTKDYSNPASSLSIAKGAVMTPVVGNQWDTENTSNSKYKLSKAFAANYNSETSTWEEVVATTDLTLSLLTVSTSNNWEFNFNVAEGSELATGWYKVPATVDGSDRDVLMEYAVYGNGTKHLFIYKQCFNSTAKEADGKCPETSFSIAKDAVLTPVVANKWQTADLSRDSYKLTRAFSANYNTETSAWEEVVTTIDLTLSLSTVSTSNNWEFNFNVAEGSELATGWYKVPATVDGSNRDVLMEYAVYGNGTKHLFIYKQCFNDTAKEADGKYPESSFSIAKDAVLTPVVANKWGTEDVSRSKYKLTETFSATYNTETSAWEEASSQQAAAIDVTLSLKEVNASSQWEFNYTLPEGKEFGSGFYRVPATVDGTVKDVLIEYIVWGNGTKHLFIYEHTFNAPPSGGKSPKVSFSIAADAVMTPVLSSDWVTEDTARSKYKLTEEFSATYNTTTSTWEEAGTQQAAPIDISLGLMLVDPANNNWKFNFTVAEGSEFATGWYKVPTTVDGENRDVLMEYAVLGDGSKQLYIYGHCFNATPTNGKYPKSSFSIAADAIMTPVVTSSWDTEDTARSKYKLTEAFSATYNAEALAWEEAGSHIEVTTINIASVASWSSDTVFPIKIGNQDVVSGTQWHSEINTASKPTWKRVQGNVNIDGVDTQITIDFPGNGEMFFNVSSDKEKMIIKADTLFQATNANFRVKFDKDYEVYIAERLIYEEGKRPVEKEPIPMHMTFNKVANGTFDFKYGSEVEGHPVANQFYHVTAIIDGVEKEILVETGGTSGLAYIYPHCFASAPNKNSTPPTSSLEFEKGAVFYPVDKNTWSKNIGTQTYTLDETVSVIFVENTWMDEGYYNQISGMEPLEVEVRLESAKGKALRLQVVTASGKTIEEIYGDWTTAYGPIKRGVLNGQGQYEFTTVPSAIYSLTKEYFYFDSLALGELDALQIDAGTVIYPAEGCKSMQPMKIMNNFGIVRDAKDKWALDEEFTTDYPNLDFKESSTTAVNTGNKASANKEVKATESTETTKTSKDAKDTNKGVILNKNVGEDSAAYVSIVANTTAWIVGVVLIAIVLCAGIVIFLMQRKQRKKQQEE